jgi:hypothetical protein
MNFSSLAELYRILIGSFDAGALWLLVAAVPWVTAALVRVLRGPGSTICRTCACAAGAAVLFWLVTLLAVDTAGEADGVNTWFLLFLYYSLPVWLMLWSVFGATAFAYRKIAGVEPEEDAEDEGDEPTP